MLLCFHMNYSRDHNNNIHGKNTTHLIPNLIEFACIGTFLSMCVCVCVLWVTHSVPPLLPHYLTDLRRICSHFLVSVHKFSSKIVLLPRVIAQQQLSKHEALFTGTEQFIRHKVFAYRILDSTLIKGTCCFTKSQVRREQWVLQCIIHSEIYTHYSSWNIVSIPILAAEDVQIYYV